MYKLVKFWHILIDGPSFKIDKAKTDRPCIGLGEWVHHWHGALHYIMMLILDLGLENSHYSHCKLCKLMEYTKVSSGPETRVAFLTKHTFLYIHCRLWSSSCSSQTPGWRQLSWLASKLHCISTETVNNNILPYVISAFWSVSFQYCTIMRNEISKHPQYCVLYYNKWP